MNARIELNKERKQLANGHGRLVVGTHLSNNPSDRGSLGTIRFMIDPEREAKECGMLEGAPDGGMGRSKVAVEGSPWFQ